jgi:hypothetical protein
MFATHGNVSLDFPHPGPLVTSVITEELTADCRAIPERSQGRRSRLQARDSQCRPNEDLHGPDRLAERYVQQQFFGYQWGLGFRRAEGPVAAAES